MTRSRTIATGGGVLLLSLGTVTVVAPALLGPLQPVFRSVFDAGVADSALSLLAIGVATAFGGILVARRRVAGGRATRPDFERLIGGVDSTTAGAGFDARLRELREAETVSRRQELADSLREDLRSTAITVLVRTGDLTADEARTRLDRGTWSDDPQAVAVFTGTSPPWSVRLREWLSAQSGTQQRLASAIGALEARLDDAATTDDRSGSQERPARDDAELGGDEPPTGAPAGTARHGVAENTGETAVDTTVTRTARVTGEDGPSELVAPRTFGVAVGLITAALGVVTGTATPLLLGVTAIGYTAFKYATDAPPPTVAVTRVVGSDEPVPGDLVDVQVTVENIGERPLTDLRVIDGPPDALRVVEGSPSLLTSLQPGGTDRISYTIRSKRGEFTFGETTLVTRSLSGVRERTRTVTVPTRLSSTTLLEEFPLRDQASQRVGTVKTGRGGSGIEFYATREYREGDPLGRIDWNHLAKTGTLTTVQFREQRAPTVAILLDERDVARVAPKTAALDGVDLSVHAAEQALLTLLDAGTEVGLITYGESLSAIDPGNDAAQRARMRAELRAATDRYAAALSQETVESAVRHHAAPTVETLRAHVPRNAQVLVLSPGTDDFVVEATDRLRAFGHPVTLLSPAIVGTDGLGARRQQLERTCRLRAIRETGVRVIDWHPNDPLQTALARATALRT